MAASSSLSNPAPVIDWADDTDEEIDFDAPVFSDDEDLYAANADYIASRANADHKADDSDDDNRPPDTAFSSSSPPTARRTPGQADGSNRPRDRRTQNDSYSRSSNRTPRDHSSSYRDIPGSRSDLHGPGSHRPPAGQYSSSLERESRSLRGGALSGSPHVDEHSNWGKNNNDRGGSGQQRPARQVIPLPPKPAASLDANHQLHGFDRSRSPSYRARSPLPGAEGRWESSGQRPMSPLARDNRSHSPSSAGLSTGLSTRSKSRDRPSRAHMDQVSTDRDHSRRNPKEAASDGRWEKVAHEDKPYPTRSPTNPSRPHRDGPRDAPKDAHRDAPRDAHRDAPRDAPRDAHRDAPRDAPRDAHRDAHRDAPRDAHRDAPKDAPKDDIIYFRRRDGQPTETTTHDTHDRNERSDQGDRNERLEKSDSRHERGGKSDSNERFERNNRPERGDRFDKHDRNDRHDRDDRRDRNDRHDRHDRNPTRTMYHERMEANDSSRRRRSSERQDKSTERWEKNAVVEPDLPYPQRSHPPASSNNGETNHGRGNHAKGGSKAQLEAMVGGSLHHEKPTQQRGKGRDHHKGRSKDRPESPSPEEEQDSQSKDDGGVPWWEQSTYGVKKPEPEPKPDPKPESKPEPKQDPKPESKSGSKPAPKTKQEGRKGRHKDTTAATLSGAKEAHDPAADTNQEAEEVPWWEQSTYKIKATTDPVEQTSDAHLADANLKSGTSQGTRNDAADTIARRKAMGQKGPPSGVEGMSLVSRGGEDSGSSNSLKARSVQEQVFSEIKAMISTYEEQYGIDKLEAIPSRSRQFEQLDKIVESFRKLREGLFATEARDMFAVEVYEQSVLYSLLAGNIPELTKALYHLVQELHPAVYNRTQPSTRDSTCLVEIPSPRQRFLGLYILYHMAKPTRPRAAVTGDTPMKDSFAQSITHPKTETDELVASLLQVYEQHLRGCSSGLDPDLVFALAYWKSLRDGNWIRRERLLESSGQNSPPASWDQRLMIRYSVGDSLKSARTISVATISKAYYSLSIAVMAQATGLTEEQESVGSSPTHVNTTDTTTLNDQWLKELQSSYGLSPSITLLNGQLMLKSKR